MIKELFAKVTRRQQQQAAAQIAGIKGLIVAIAEQELGNAMGKIDVDRAADMLEAEGISESELRANVERYKRRRQLAEIAARQSDLFSRAERLRSEMKAESEAEVRRREEWNTKWERMETGASGAEADYLSTIEAVTELQDTFEPAEKLPDLSAELSAVNAQIEAAQWAVKPSGNPINRTSVSTWPHIDVEPALLAVQTRAALAKCKKSRLVDPAECTKLERQLATAERAVEGRKAELARLEKERDALNARMAQEPGDHLRPENFKLIHKPQKGVTVG